MKKNTLVLLMLGCLVWGNSNKIFSQESYLGDIKITAITFAQEGWMDCNGQVLQIISNQALFSLLGTTYGGDGRTTFALPDLRGRVPIHTGTGNALTTYTQGERAGSEFVHLTETQLPAHSHSVSVNSLSGTSSQAEGNYLANSGVFDKEYATSTDKTNTVMIQSTGGGTAIENRPPLLTVRYVICTQGLYPPRN
ncbi:phage tail protein [Saccharicrinis fermentans]|uniref:Phage Tail Collar Domain protein n=1 Tax=Saccharicrinis fermentans DSM 9555 = JCM 21142 TaxID=869213 RepID=W7Y0P5_9BACT|nr:tail fiber protein [Saccharicrinis fermentans]GAF04495.1 phage Tail Collar Domain protein [Saccharicrinis fermentans DSM 9555 = JCM 21142]